MYEFCSLKLTKCQYLNPPTQITANNPNPAPTATANPITLIPTEAIAPPALGLLALDPDPDPLPLLDEDPDEEEEEEDPLKFPEEVARTEAALRGCFPTIPFPTMTYSPMEGIPLTTTKLQ